jgi:hypothetical protein
MPPLKALAEDAITKEKGDSYDFDEEDEVEEEEADDKGIYEFGSDSEVEDDDEGVEDIWEALKEKCKIANDDDYGTVLGKVEVFLASENFDEQSKEEQVKQMSTVHSMAKELRENQFK